MSEVNEQDLITGKINSLIAALELEVSLETEVEGDTLHFNLVGPDHGYFLNHKAEPIKNLSFLMQSVLERSFPDSKTRVKMDAESYLRTKESELHTLAFNAADALKQVGDEISLDPLNPYDRRIVHMALADKPHLDTQSMGEGHFKKVVIRYKESE